MRSEDRFGIHSERATRHNPHKRLSPLTKGNNRKKGRRAATLADVWVKGDNQRKKNGRQAATPYMAIDVRLAQCYL
jgi:hypothetical protein